LKFFLSQSLGDETLCWSRARAFSLCSFCFCWLCLWNFKHTHNFHKQTQHTQHHSIFCSLSLFRFVSLTIKSALCFCFFLLRLRCLSFFVVVVLVASKTNQNQPNNNFTNTWQFTHKRTQTNAEQKRAQKEDDLQTSHFFNKTVVHIFSKNMTTRCQTKLTHTHTFFTQAQF
jgi:hypothetical protein